MIEMGFVNSPPVEVVGEEVLELVDLRLEAHALCEGLLVLLLQLADVVVQRVHLLLVARRQRRHQVL